MSLLEPSSFIDRTVPLLDDFVTAVADLDVDAVIALGCREAR